MRGRFVSLKYTNEWASDGVAFGPNRPFHTKLSLGSVNPSHSRANNLQTFVEDRSCSGEQSSSLNLCVNASSYLLFVIFCPNAFILWNSSRIFIRAKDTEHGVEQVSTMAFYLEKNTDGRVFLFSKKSHFAWIVHFYCFDSTVSCIVHNNTSWTFPKYENGN